MIDQINILDCVDIINNSVVSYEGVRGYLDTGGLKSNKIVEIRDFDFNDKPSRANQNVEVGDIILARMQATTKVKVISQSESELMVSTGFIVLRPKRTIIDNNFLNHTLISPFFQRKKDKLCSGSTQKAINNGNFKKLKIPLPPLDQQKKIAAILDAADAYRQKTKALIEKYDELTQSLFLDMFGDTWLNPNEYKLQKLSELVNEGKIITYGIVQAGDHVEDGIPYIRTGDIKNGKINTQGLLRTSQEIANSYMRSKCSAGDIIMSIRATVGTIAFLPDEMDGANLTQGTARISTDDKLANPLFLYHCIKSRGIQLRIDQQTKGATFREITLTRLRNIEIPLPNLDLQNQFAERVQAIEAQKAKAQASLAQAEDLFNSLLQKAFKGELIN